MSISVSHMQRAIDLLVRCGTAQAVMPPTALYNEGWMLRLFLDWFSQHELRGHALSFLPGARWYSEALLPSQFAARSRGDPLAESWTHADGVVGHFDLPPGRGDIRLRADAQQFVVAEAKMFSGLSVGTRRAGTFDQVARTVACMGRKLSQSGIRPESIKRLAFLVVAPGEQRERGVFGNLLDKQAIGQTVRDRCGAYCGAKTEWFESWFMPTLRKIDVDLLSWEQLCTDVRAADSGGSSELEAFLDLCLQHNRPKFSHRRSNVLRIKVQAAV
jgi:hypothetical protein